MAILSLLGTLHLFPPFCQEKDRPAFLGLPCPVWCQHLHMPWLSAFPVGGRLPFSYQLLGTDNLREFVFDVVPDRDVLSLL